MKNKEAFLQEVTNFSDWVTDCRRHLHQIPGVGFDIADTVAFVEEKLTEMGYEVQHCGRAGLVVLAGKGVSGKTFLIRADMDALPVQEESGEPFASQNGRMHACGHDLHTSMLLGAARILKAHEDEIEGTVKLMFQPAEETMEGAKDMLANGVLENPKVDAAMMIHVMSNMPLAPGTVLVAAPGVGAPAADFFEIKVKGVGCHGSMPNKGIDPLSAAAHILIALQEIHGRELAMGERAVMTIGYVQGGLAPNVIPDAVTMGGTIRTFENETRAMMQKRLTEISQNVAAAFRAEATVDFISGCPPLRNDGDVGAKLLTYAQELLPAGKAMSMQTLIEKSGESAAGFGSEDFAYVSQKVPSVMLTLAAGEPDKGHCYPQHHPMVTFDESALAEGAAVYAYLAMRWLEEAGK